MPPESDLQMTRKQLYDEVWSISAAGVARKYGLSYPHLLKVIKQAKVPTPPSGYWTKKSFHKETKTIALAGNPDTVISLEEAKLDVIKPVPENPVVHEEKAAAGKSSHIPADTKAEEEPKAEQENTPPVDTAPHTPARILGIPVYDREILYRDVWNNRMEEVSEAYGVSNTSLIKLCKALSVPIPPAGYFKKQKGSRPAVPDLPQNTTPARKAGAVYTSNNVEKLSHLSQEGQSVVLAAARYISLKSDRERLSPKVSHCQGQLRQQKKGETICGAESVSKESIPRIIRILDALVKTAIPLGIDVDDQLDFSIGEDRIQLEFSEAMDKSNHQITSQEKYDLVKYEEERK